MHTIQEPLSNKFLEVALIINNVDVTEWVLKDFINFTKLNRIKKDDTKSVSSYIRNLCHESHTDILPINMLLDNDSNINLWLTNLEEQVIPYLISSKILKRN